MQGQYNCETEKKEERTKSRAEFAGFSILHLLSWYWLEEATGRSQQEPRLPGALQGIHFFVVVPLFFFNLKVYTGPTYPSTHIFFFSLSLGC